MDSLVHLKWMENVGLVNSLVGVGISKLTGKLCRYDIVPSFAVHPNA